MANSHTLALSIRQADNISRFKTIWSDVTKLKSSFTPIKAGAIIANMGTYINYPQIYLSQINEAYGDFTLDMYFAIMMFTSIYAQGNANSVCNAEVINTNASLFISQYGQQCTMFDLMNYMGTYRSKYKSEFANSGDLSDVIRQFPKYLKYKAYLEETNKPKQEEPQQKGKKVVGIEALELYLKTAAGRGENIANGGLISFGIVTKEHALEVMAKECTQK